MAPGFSAMIRPAILVSATYAALACQYDRSAADFLCPSSIAFGRCLRSLRGADPAHGGSERTDAHASFQDGNTPVQCWNRLSGSAELDMARSQQQPARHIS